MEPVPFPERYVVALMHSGGKRLFCTDELRDQWSGHVYDASKYRALHEAERIAELHGAVSMTVQEALALT
jgi:hypothetical protein